MRDSDATVIFTFSEKMKGGTLLTEKLAREKWNHPCLHNVLRAEEDKEMLKDDDLALFHSFIIKHEVRVLNVAGPRESEAPGIGGAVERFLLRAL